MLPLRGLSVTAPPRQRLSLDRDHTPPVDRQVIMIHPFSVLTEILENVRITNLISCGLQIDLCKSGYYRLPTKLQKGIVFTGIYLFTGVGVGTHPHPVGGYLSPSRYKDLVYYRIKLTRGRYASYWNAFLFINLEIEAYRTTFKNFLFWKIALNTSVCRHAYKQNTHAYTYISQLVTLFVSEGNIKHMA